VKSKIWSAAALAFAALIPIATAAGQSCTDGIQLNFCGSTQVAASSSNKGRTVVVVTALSAATFTAIRLSRSHASSAAHQGRYTIAFVTDDQVQRTRTDHTWDAHQINVDQGIKAPSNGNDKSKGPDQNGNDQASEKNSSDQGNGSNSGDQTASGKGSKNDENSAQDQNSNNDGNAGDGHESQGGGSVEDSHGSDGGDAKDDGKGSDSGDQGNAEGGNGSDEGDHGDVEGGNGEGDHGDVEGGQDDHGDNGDDDHEGCKLESSSSFVTSFSHALDETTHNEGDDKDDDDCLPPPTTTSPEPATMALFGTGMFVLAGAGYLRRRRSGSD
jgi:hypothetical protein